MSSHKIEFKFDLFNSTHMIGHSGISNASDWLIVQQYLTKVYNPPDGIRISAHDDVFMGGGFALAFHSATNAWP